MFRCEDALLLTKEAKEKARQLDNENYKYLMKVAEDPNLLGSEVEDYEKYIDKAINDACLETVNYAYIKSFSSLNYRVLLNLFSEKKTSQVEFSVFCNLIDRWFEDNLLTRYTETGYKVDPHTKVSYTIKWY